MARKKKGGAATILQDLLKIDLSAGQVVNTSPGSLVYMRGDIQKGNVNIGSIGKAFARAFAGEDFFLTKYTAGTKGGTVALSLSFPGNIVQIVLQPKESYRISKGCFLACTDNITISATPQWKGLIPVGQDEGVIMPKVTCDGTSPGVVWLGGYGYFEKHELKDESDTLTVDNGVFLACPFNMPYKIVQLGTSVWSSFAGQEGFGMEFRGPGVVYTQSKNFNEFLMLVGTVPDTSITNAAMNKVNENIGNKIGNVLTSFIDNRINGQPAEGGAKKRRKPKV